MKSLPRLSLCLLLSERHTQSRGCWGVYPYVGRMWAAVKRENKQTWSCWGNVPVNREIVLLSPLFSERLLDLLAAPAHLLWKTNDFVYLEGGHAAERLWHPRGPRHRWGDTSLLLSGGPLCLMLCVSNMLSCKRDSCCLGPMCVFASRCSASCTSSPLLSVQVVPDH